MAKTTKMGKITIIAGIVARYVFEFLKNVVTILFICGEVLKGLWSDSFVYLITEPNT